jgi:hypothetical protein
MISREMPPPTLLLLLLLLLLLIPLQPLPPALLPSPCMRLPQHPTLFLFLQVLTPSSSFFRYSHEPGHETTGAASARQM